MVNFEHGLPKDIEDDVMLWVKLIQINSYHIQGRI